MKWKILDPDMSPQVVVDEKNCYIATANCATSAKLFVQAHNATEEANDELFKIKQRTVKENQRLRGKLEPGLQWQE